MPTLEVKCFDTLIVIFDPYQLFLCLTNLKRLDDGKNSLLDLDEIVAKYKVEYDRTSKMDLAKNITLNRKGLKSQLVTQLVKMALIIPIGNVWRVILNLTMWKQTLTQ